MQLCLCLYNPNNIKNHYYIWQKIYIYTLPAACGKNTFTLLNFSIEAKQNSSAMNFSIARILYIPLRVGQVSSLRCHRSKKMTGCFQQKAVLISLTGSFQSLCHNVPLYNASFTIIKFKAFPD